MAEMVSVLLERAIKAAWREGWELGYRSGRVDGRSDGTQWCDIDADWAQSSTAVELAAPLPQPPVKP